MYALKRANPSKHAKQIRSSMNAVLSGQTVLDAFDGRAWEACRWVLNGYPPADRSLSKLSRQFNIGDTLRHSPRVSLSSMLMRDFTSLADELKFDRDKLTAICTCTLILAASRLATEDPQSEFARSLYAKPPSSERSCSPGLLDHDYAHQRWSDLASRLSSYPEMDIPLSRLAPHLGVRWAQSDRTRTLRDFLEIPLNRVIDMPGIGRVKLDLIMACAEALLEKKGRGGAPEDPKILVCLTEKAAAISGKIDELGGFVEVALNNLQACTCPKDFHGALNFLIESLIEYALLHKEHHTQRERDILVKRFGLVNPPRRLQEIGTEYGLSRERVRQIILLYSSYSIDYKKEWQDGVVHALLKGIHILADKSDRNKLISVATWLLGIEKSRLAPLK